MDITEVRIKLTEDSGERLKAFCSVTLDDCFVVRDLKIIEGTNGPFVAMPSRKLTFHCPACRGKNHLRAAHCNQCGNSLREFQPAADEEGRIKLYADIAHPINSQCRELIQHRVIRAYERELEESRQPGYVSHYDDYDGDDWELDAPPRREKRRQPPPPREKRRSGCELMLRSSRDPQPQPPARDERGRMRRPPAARTRSLTLNKPPATLPHVGKIIRRAASERVSSRFVTV